MSADEPPSAEPSSEPASDDEEAEFVPAFLNDGSDMEDELGPSRADEEGDDDDPTKNNFKKSWTEVEDRILSEIVAKGGAHKWSTIAASLPGRAGKQCRERWYNHLCPEVRKGSWTAEEDHIIMESVREHGTKWSFIVKKLPGRTDNAIKNRYNSAMRRQKRLQRLEEAAANGEVVPTRPRGRPEGSGKKAKRKHEDEEENGAGVPANGAGGAPDGAAPEPSPIVKLPRQAAKPRVQKEPRASPRVAKNSSKMPQLFSPTDSFAGFSPTGLGVSPIGDDRMAQLTAMWGLRVHRRQPPPEPLPRRRVAQ